MACILWPRLKHDWCQYWITCHSLLFPYYHLSFYLYFFPCTLVPFYFLPSSLSPDLIPRPSPMLIHPAAPAFPALNLFPPFKAVGSSFRMASSPPSPSVSKRAAPHTYNHSCLVHKNAKLRFLASFKKKNKKTKKLSPKRREEQCICFWHNCLRNWVLLEQVLCAEDGSLLEPNGCS